MKGGLVCLLVVVVVLGAVCAADKAAVVSPPHLAMPFPVLLFRRFIGPQDTNVTIPPTRLSVVRTARVLDSSELECAAMGGTVAYVDNMDAPWMQKDQLEMFLALQQCGVVAIIHGTHPLQGSPDFVGAHYHTTDHNCCKARGHEVVVPVLEVFEGTLSRVASDVLGGVANVTVQIQGVDTNPWVEVYHHIAFTLCVRVFLPALNIVVAVIALRAMVRHVRVQRSNVVRRKSVFDSMRPYIILSLAFQIVGCAIRIAYCTTNPFSSTPNLTYQEETMLINLSVPVQFPGLFVVSAMCRRVISMTNVVASPPMRWVVPIALYCAALFVAMLASGYARGYQFGSETLLSATLLLVLVTLLAMVVFAALPFFVRLLESRRTRATSQINMGRGVAALLRRRFVNNVVLGYCWLVAQCIPPILLAVLPHVVLSPIGLPTALGLYYLAITMTTLHFTLAFSPIFWHRPQQPPPSLPPQELKSSFRVARQPTSKLANAFIVGDDSNANRPPPQQPPQQPPQPPPQQPPQPPPQQPAPDDHWDKESERRPSTHAEHSERHRPRRASWSGQAADNNNNSSNNNSSSLMALSSSLSRRAFGFLARGGSGDKLARAEATTPAGLGEWEIDYALPEECVVEWGDNEVPQ